MAQESTPSPSLFEMFAAGEKFGDYQVMEVLAAGPLAALYRLQGIGSGKEEIFLVPPAEAVSNSLLKVRIKESVGRFSRFDTPSLWRPEACVEIAGRPCCRLATRDLVPLSRWMAQQMGRKAEEIPPVSPGLPVYPAGLPVARAKDLLVDIAGAVEAAHIAGFKHFALDPRWVFVGPDGKVALAGFNFAELLGVDLLSLKVRDNQSSTQTGFSTDLDFLAPEIRRGQPADYPADSFGFGGIVYYVLTGRRPAFRLSREAAREAAPLSSLVPGLPPDWDEFTSALLREDPAKRPDVFDKLKQQLGQLPVAAQQAAKAKVSGKSMAVNIPLPESVSKRLSPKGVATLRASLLLFFGVAVVGLGWIFSSMFSEKGPATGLVAVDAITETPPGRKPHLQLSFSPAKVSVTLAGGEGQTGRFAVTNGRLLVSLPRGTYKLRAEARDHQPASLDNVFVDGRDTVIRSLRLNPMWGLLELRATPGAFVVAKRDNGDETRHGPVPPEGLFLMDQHLVRGVYTLTVEKTHFDSVVLENVVVSEQLTVSKAELKPHPASVTVKSDPAGARVLMDGKDMGKTPLRLEGLPVGRQLEFSIRASAFRERKIPVTLEPGDDFELDTGDLRAALGNVDLSITLGERPADPADLARVAVFIGTTRLAVQSRYEALPAGRILMRVEHPDYEMFTAEATVRDSENVSIRAILTPRAARLRVVTNPPVAVSLFSLENGQAQALTSEGNNIFRLAPLRRVEVEARATDHESKRAFFTLRPNEQGEWKLTLERLAPPADGNPYVIPIMGLTLNWVPPGSFTMGSPPAEQGREPSEGPETNITFSKGFWASKFEVTQDEYARVMRVPKTANPTINLNPSVGATKLTGNHPVQNVSWDDADRFCRAINDVERNGRRLPNGYLYRLPTEAEWEYLARAGGLQPFHFDLPANASKGQFQGFYPRDATAVSSKFPSTAPVGSFTPNAWGFYDVHGNVREWCLNWYAARLPGGSLPNWAGPATGKVRSVRGGSWESSAKESRVATRDSRSPDNTSAGTGIRLVLAPEL